VANQQCVALTMAEVKTPDEVTFVAGIDVVPIIDAGRRVVAIAQPQSRDFMIGRHAIEETAPTFVIAEIGINHNGSLETALRLVDAAAESGADCAKFQLRDMSSLYRHLSPHSAEDLGAQYTLDLLSESSLSLDDTLVALDHAKSAGMIALCTPWDIPSANVLLDYGVDAIKVASADLTNLPLITKLLEAERPLIVSTGMSTETEIREAVALLRRAVGGYALLQCSSSYPAPFKDLNLRYMKKLASIGNCHVGYSGHERGFHIPLAAVALGARIVEKHITFDKSARGNDHRVSLEPQEFKQMVSLLRDVEAALGTEDPRRLTQGEALNRLSLGKSLVATRSLEVGDVVQIEDVEVKGPGRGLQPNSCDKLIGVTLTRAVCRGDFFYSTDIEGLPSGARNYSFERPWGLPVRFHDWRDLAERSNPDFLEFHLSYTDLDVNLREVIDDSMPFGLVVHSPDLFQGDLILDLASPDEARRSASIRELQQVVDLTRRMTPQFRVEAPPLIVVSLGGSTIDAPVDPSQRQSMYERVLISLNALDLADVEIVAQTLPPYPWYLGGQRHCNLFVDPRETATFADQSGVRLCFDIAHTKLATNHLHGSFSEASETLLPFSAHLHLVDAAGIDDEGLQIFEGEVDWSVLADQMQKFAPNVGFIPEIWQGHVNSGRGFWTALERLESILAAR